jgi:hypothetical protein
MRNLTLVVLAWLTKEVTTGDRLTVAVSGEHLRKGTGNFSRLSTPFLDSFHQIDPHTPALLVDYL